MAGSGSAQEGRRRVHVVDGARTPFLKARTGPGPFTGSDLAVHAGRPLLLRQPFEPDAFDEVIVGAAHALGGRGQHRARRLAAPGLRREGARVDRDAQLRLGNAGARFRGGQHRRGPLAPRARRRHRRDEPRAAPVRAGDGEVARAVVCREGPRAEGRARHALPAFPPRARHRDPARPDRPRGEDLHGLDGGDRREALRHHARR